MGRTEDGGRVVVSDAGPLIHLHELDALQVLDFPEILIPSAVWHEVTRHRPETLQSPALSLRPRRVDALPPTLMATASLFGLHRGEQEALALCAEAPGSILLTDDAAARMAAGSLSVTAHGSIGLIVRGVRRQILTPQQGLNRLTAIPERSSLHVRPALLADVIRMVRQQWD